MLMNIERASELIRSGRRLLIVPASSDMHVRFAQDAPGYPEIFAKPIVGWLSGIHLDDLGWVTPKVVDGRSVEVFSNRGVAMHCELPEGNRAEVGVVDLYEGNEGDVLTFPQDGISVTKCKVNGEVRSFASYIDELEFGPKMPLVTEVAGKSVNVSLKSVDWNGDRVELHAPVFSGTEYRIAQPVADFDGDFRRALPNEGSPVFCCNSMLSYRYGGLNSRDPIGLQGPISFGEIAQLALNQTLVYLSIA